MRVHRMLFFVMVMIVLSGCVEYEVVEKKTATPTPNIVQTPGQYLTNKTPHTKWWEKDTSKK